MTTFMQGEMIEFDFSPSLGVEPAKRRPALVVSSNEFNLKTSMTLVCPITSTDNGFPLHIKLPDEIDVTGFVVTEQVRAFDLQSRQPKHIGQLNAESKFMIDVKTLIKSFL